MTADQARQAIETRLLAQWATAHPTYPVFMSGDREPDLATQSLPFIRVRVQLPSVRQSGMNGANPPRRYVGQVYIGLFVKEGAGGATLFKMTDTLVAALTCQVVSGVRLTKGSTYERISAIGWQSRVFTVDYEFDSN